LSATKPTYDLVLLLDLAVPEEERAKTVTDVRTQIESEGELVLEQGWGERALAYPIDHREQADYHLLQLHGGAPLIESLDRSLRLNDAVVRHRIIKLAPGTPAPPEHVARSAAPTASAPPAAAPPAVAPPAPDAQPEAEAESAGADALAPA
jgi:small subunit ribosomal protein S6